MIRTDESLIRAVEDVTRAAARPYVGLVVGALAGSRTAVYGAGSMMDGGGPPIGDTLFQIGSITKVFTALALAEAVVRSELTLDTPLATYMPEAPTCRSGAPITLAHLAAHTSGLPRLPKGMRRQALRNRLDPYREFTTADLLAALAAARPRHEPGTKVRYSNFGAALLGEALSRHAGLPYEGLIAERVAGPLRLCDTVVRPRPYQVDRRATGHSNRRRAVPDWDLGAMPGAGALYSTVNDLLMLLRTHLEPDTCALPEAVRLVQQPRATAHRWLRVGLGWHLSPVRGTQHSALWHNGGTGGFASYVALMPDAHVGVVVLTNTARPVDRVGIRLLQRLANPLELRAS